MVLHGGDVVQRSASCVVIAAVRRRAQTVFIENGPPATKHASGIAARIQNPDSETVSPGREGGRCHFLDFKASPPPVAPLGNFKYMILIGILRAGRVWHGYCCQAGTFNAQKRALLA
jgi:hypothetical protein